MKQLETKLNELKEMLIEDGYNDSNIVLQTIGNIRLEAINYTRCCKSDSEQLLAYTNFLRKELHLNISDTWVESYIRNSK